MSDWKEYKVEDFCEVIGGGTPSTKEASYYGGSFSWITPRDLTNHNNRFISKGERNITELGLRNSSTRILPKNSILLTSRAPIGYIAIAENEVCTNQGFKSLIVNPEKADYNFVYYLIKSNIERIKGLGTGTTFAEISGSVVKNLKFYLPDLPTQTAIAEILSSLDDKIELNNKINQELENLAQTLFKRWFVDFDFPNENGKPYKSSGGEMDDSELGEIPKGWEVSRLDDVIEFHNGYAFSSKELENTDSGDCFHVFKMGHIKKGGGFNAEGTKSWYNKSKATKLSRYVLKKGDLLMCMTDMKGNVALLGHTALMNVDDKYIVNQRVGLLRPKNQIGIDFPYLYILTNSVDFIEELRSRANSGVQVNLSTSEIKASKIILPSKNINLKFDNILKGLFESIFNNTKENQQLTNLRDTLLQKLISGELKVQQVEPQST
jgi:type I restriction enzyme S subunit